MKQNIAKQECASSVVFSLIGTTIDCMRITRRLLLHLVQMKGNESRHEMCTEQKT